MLNRIILGGVGRIVRDPDFDAQGLRQLLQVLFKQIGPGAVTSASITQHQQGIGGGVRGLPIALPPLE
jgi:hypothetical protein